MPNKHAPFQTAGSFCRVTKLDERLGIVQGYGIVTTVKQADGSYADYYDLQGDHISDEEMAKAALGFAASGAVADDMHDDGNHGWYPGVFALTAEFCEKNAIDADKRGLLLTCKPSAEIFAKFVSGEYTGFSIGGKGRRDSVGKRADLAKSQPDPAAAHVDGPLDGKKKRSKLRDLEITKISAVDLPAQEGALATLIKSANGDFDALLTSLKHEVLFEKAAKKPAESDKDDDEDEDCADAYAKRDYSQDERDSMAGKEAMKDGSFPIKTVKDLHNAIGDWGRGGKSQAVAAHIKSRAKALGATDQLPTDGPLAEALGTQKTEKAMDKDEVIKSLRAELDVLKAFAAMSDAEKAHHDSLDSDGAKEKFKAMSKEDRADAMKKRLDADPVVYTSPITGEEFRKSAGQRTVDMAKRLDSQDAALAKAAAIEKRRGVEERIAKSYKNMPGSLDVQCAIVSALDGIGDEALRKAALESLEGMTNATGMAAAFEKRGTTGGLFVVTGGDGAEAELNKLAKAHQDKNAGMTFAKAYDHIAHETQEGRALLAKVRMEQRANAR